MQILLQVAPRPFPDLIVRTPGSRLPELRSSAWASTRDALHAYAQVAGAVRTAFSPAEKHWYHVSLRAAASGLTTTPVAVVAGTFEITLEFATSQWTLTTSDGSRWQIPLRGQSAAALFADTAALLARMGVRVRTDQKQFGRRPYPDYDAEAAARYGQVLSWVDAQFKRFKASQRGETSPVQLWPHHFDIALLVFSGRKIPGEDPRDPEASDEQMNFGFVPGDEGIREAYFYATAYPNPKRRRPTLPRGARWHTRGWDGAVLSYATLTASRDPQARLLEFLRAFRRWGDF